MIGRSRMMEEFKLMINYFKSMHLLSVLFGGKSIQLLLLSPVGRIGYV